MALATTYGVTALVWTWSSSVAKRCGTVVHNLPVVETPRLRLRPSRSGDARAVAAFTDAEILATQGWTAPMRDGVIELIEASSVFRPDYWVVADRGSDEPLGVIGVDSTDQATTCQIGWWLRRDSRGTGLGTESLRAALTALHSHGFVEISLGTSADNTVVQRVADKVGATFVENKQHTLPDGSVTDSVWYVHTAGAPAAGDVS